MSEHKPLAKIRIAQHGYKRADWATTGDEVEIGLRLPWVEIEGHRIENGLVSARFEATDDAFTIAEVTIRVAGPIEVVYVGPNGEVLGAEPLDLAELDGKTLDHNAITVKGGKGHVEAAT